MTSSWIVLAVALVLAGGGLWWWSIVLTLRAYRGERFSFWVNPRKAPGRAVAARAFGAGLLVLGIGLVPWTALALPAWAASVFAGVGGALLLFLPYVASVVGHNRRVDSAA
ncbi:MAG: hypothetical protein PIR02_05410 [Microbacterium enclense]